jgi:hypothetical protein
MNHEASQEGLMSHEASQGGLRHQSGLGHQPPRVTWARCGSKAVVLVVVGDDAVSAVRRNAGSDLADTSGAGRAGRGGGGAGSATPRDMDERDG